VTRIFTLLAWFAILLVAANLIIGLSLGEHPHNPTKEVAAWETVAAMIKLAARAESETRQHGEDAGHLKRVPSGQW